VIKTDIASHVIKAVTVRTRERAKAISCHFKVRRDILNPSDQSLSI
jgi:hypothetical protein